MNTKEIAASYNRDGYCIAPRLLNDEECDALKTEALRVMREHARKEGTVYVGASLVSQTFHHLADDPRIVAILEEIMPAGVAFLSDKIVLKSGKHRFATPWHIDAFYWKNTRPKLSVWIPLDDAAAENGTLVVVRGSHQQPLQSVKKNGPNDEFGEQLERGDDWCAGDEVVCNVARGSAVFFSDRVAHASCPNASGRDRYTIINTYHAPAEDEPFDKQFPARHVIIPAS